MVKRSRKIIAYYYVLDVRYKRIKVRKFFSQFPNQTIWNLLLTDNIQLTFHENIRIYQIRFGIDFYFKEVKQYLRLDKCQSNDFNAQITYFSLIMIAYMKMSLKKRLKTLENIGEAFRKIQHELKKATLLEKLFGLFCELLSLSLCYFKL